MNRYTIGQRVRAKFDLDEHLSDEGFAPSTCARGGDVLVIRGYSPYKEGRYSVSHEHRTDGNTFSAEHDELESIEEPRK